MRGPLLLLALSLHLPAQQIQLSTTFTGDTLYLTTPYPRAGKDDSPQGRVYTITPSGLTLFAESTRKLVPASGFGPQLTNYYSFTAAEVTPDGRTLALSARRDCLSGSRCIDVPTLQTELSGAVQLTVGNRVQFSPNGRWLLRFSDYGIGSQPGGLTDLATLAESPLAIYSDQLHAGTQVSNDGAVVLNQAGFRLLPYAASQSIPVTSLLAEDAAHPNLSPDASLLVFDSVWNYPYHAYRRLRVVDLFTGQPRTLLEGFVHYTQPVLSHDARRVLFLADDFLSPQQAHVIDIDGAAHRRLTNDPSGISTAILSGDGRIAYALSRSGRLLKIDIDAGQQTELLPPFIQLFSTPSLAAGSRVEFEAYDVPDLRLYLNEIPLDLTRDGLNRFHFVLPPETAGKTLRLRAESAFPEGPFLPQLYDQEVTILPYAPRALEIPPEYGGPGAYNMRFSLVYDDTLSTLITPFQPAVPGQIVNVLATGLGPLQPTCRWYSTTEAHPIEPQYIGPHPTEPGLDILRFQIPTLPAEMTYEGALQISCSSPAPYSSAPLILIPVRR